MDFIIILLSYKNYLNNYNVRYHKGDADNTMTHCGTPYWTAPEVIRQEAFDEKADVYR